MPRKQNFKLVGRRIKAALHANAALRLLLSSKARSGPFDGGCLIVAKALLHVFEKGKLIRVTSSGHGGQTEHYGVIASGYIFDAGGCFENTSHWLLSLRSDLEPTRHYSFATGFDDSSLIPDDGWAVKALAQHLLRSPSIQSALDKCASPVNIAKSIKHDSSFRREPAEREKNNFCKVTRAYQL